MASNDGPIIPFTEWTPDLTPVGTNSTPTAQNVLPRGDGYGPFASLQTFTKTLPGPCRGAFFARNNDGSVSIFAATQTNLYLLSNIDFSWINVSLGGGPYAGCPAGDNWQFAQFNNLVLAVQANVVMQAYNLLVPNSTFANQSGSPPQASHIAVINQFVVLTGLVGTPFRVQWSDVSNPSVWTPGQGQADLQDFGDGGVVHDIRGGDQYGIVFQDNAIRSMVFQPGNAVVFVFVRIATLDGIFGQYSAISAGDKIFFCSPQGLKKIESGGYPTPIGKEKIDRFFFADVDANNLQFFVAGTDPESTRVFWMYKSQSGQANLADKLLIYDWALDRWTIVVNQAIEFLFYLYKPGLSLEGLDSVAPGIISILSAADNGSGAIRLQLSGLTAGTPPSNNNLGSYQAFTGSISGTTLTVSAILVGVTPISLGSQIVGVAPNTEVIAFGPGTTGGVGTYTVSVSQIVASTNMTLAYQNTVEIYNCTGGLVAAAGNYRFTIIDSTHIDLIGSTFTSTGTGSIGGSLDQLPISLDSFGAAPLPQFGAFSSSNALGFFNGSALEATLETSAGDLGQRYFINFLRPMTDAPGCFGSLGILDTAQSTLAYTTEQQVDAFGRVPQRAETRYARAKLRIPAGSTWTYARGVKPVDIVPAGDR